MSDHIFRLSDSQLLVYDSTARFRVLIAGRRFGKTHLAGILCAQSALTHPGSDTWYTAPTYRHCKREAWRDFKSLFHPKWLVGKPNESDLYFDFVNGSRVTLVGRGQPDTLRGGGLVRLINDEFAVQEDADKGLATWEEVLAPKLADTGGDAIFITTPKGFNWGYDLYNRGQDPGKNDWESWQFTTLDGGRVPLKEVERFKSEMDPRRFSQEFLASFETMVGRVYYTFDRAIHVDESVADTGAELYIGQDFNVHPMASAIAVKVADQIHFIDSLEVPESNTTEVCQEIKQRYPDRKVIFCPDPTGSARKTSAPVGQTDFAIIKSFGFEIRSPRQAPLQVDRENNTNANLKAADGTVRVKIHPRCKALIRGWEGLTYKEGTSQRDKSSGLDHICDAADYLLWQESNLVAPKRIYREIEFAI